MPNNNFNPLKFLHPPLGKKYRSHRHFFIEREREYKTSSQRTSMGAMWQVPTEHKSQTAMHFAIIICSQSCD
jgi:hypothetical protein